MVGEIKIYTQPPEELQIGFDCLKFRTLPRSGGLRDQPLLLMHRMKTALHVYENVQTYRNAESTLSNEVFGKWCGANGKLIDFMQFIWKLQGVFEE